jgi:glutathione S-transferase
VIDLYRPDDRAALVQLWPLAKFPVLADDACGVAIPESSSVLEYAEQQYAGAPRLFPADPERAREARLRDRFYDFYVNQPMGKIVTDKLRPEGKHDPFGVAEARAELETAYDVADAWAQASTWAAGESFTLADCAAAPALFYANKVAPFEQRLHLVAYYARLCERPSVARVFAEARPYLAMFPG